MRSHPLCPTVPLLKFFYRPCQLLHVFPSPPSSQPSPPCDYASSHSLGSTPSTFIPSFIPTLSGSPVSSHKNSQTTLPICCQVPCFLSARWPAQRSHHVPVPFSLQDLAHIEQRLGSYSPTPPTTSKTLPSCLSLTPSPGKDGVFVILGSTTQRKEGHLGHSKSGSRPETS